MGDMARAGEKFVVGLKTNGEGGGPLRRLKGGGSHVRVCAQLGGNNRMMANGSRNATRSGSRNACLAENMRENPAAAVDEHRGEGGAAIAADRGDEP
jgi:hypothetical protein